MSKTRVLNTFIAGVWNIYTVTGDVDNAGVKSNVTLTLCGSAGESEAFPLTPLEGAERPFKRGATDQFVVSTSNILIICTQTL